MYCSHLYEQCFHQSIKMLISTSMSVMHLYYLNTSLAIAFLRNSTRFSSVFITPSGSSFLEVDFSRRIHLLANSLSEWGSGRILLALSQGLIQSFWPGYLNTSTYCIVSCSLNMYRKLVKGTVKIIRNMLTNNRAQHFNSFETCKKFKLF